MGVMMVCFVWVLVMVALCQTTPVQKMLRVADDKLTNDKEREALLHETLEGIGSIAVATGANEEIENTFTRQLILSDAIHEFLKQLRDTQRHKRHVEPQRTTSSTEISRLLHHILEQVRRGHVSQENMSHWKTDIYAALESGDLSHEEYNQFMSELMGLIHSDGHDAGSSSADTLLWFGK